MEDVVLLNLAVERPEICANSSPWLPSTILYNSSVAPGLESRLRWTPMCFHHYTQRGRNRRLGTRIVYEPAQIDPEMSCPPWVMQSVLCLLDTPHLLGLLLPSNRRHFNVRDKHNLHRDSLGFSRRKPMKSPRRTLSSMYKQIRESTLKDSWHLQLS
jgi:hypothetical protein